MATVQVRKFRDIGPVIQAVREDRGVRQQDLADTLAFSRDYLVDLEAGKGSLTSLGYSEHSMNSASH